MRLIAGNRGDARFQLGWAVDAVWPGLNAVTQAFAGAPAAAATFTRGQSGNAVQANVGGTVSVERIDGMPVVQLGVGVVNEQVIVFPCIPRLKQPPAGSYVNPDSLMYWWEFTSRFQAPGASHLAMWHGIRCANSATTQQNNIDSPVGSAGVGFGVGFDGAGALRAYCKRLNAAGNWSDLGGIAPPGTMTPTDRLRWGYALLAATPTRTARLRMYLNNALLMERAFDADGTGTTNNLPDYGAASGNCPSFALFAQARSDLIAGVLLGITDVRFRMGRYDVNGSELSPL